MKILQPALQNIDKLIVSIRISGPQEKTILQHKIPRIADEPLDHLAIVEINPHPKSRNDRRMFMKMQGSMAKISIEGLDEEHRLGILRRNLLHPLRIQQLKPNRIQRILGIVPQQLIDRPQLADLGGPTNRPVIIANNDPVLIGRLCRLCLGRYARSRGGDRSYCLILYSSAL
jgi:hypothetical protein